MRQILAQAEPTPPPAALAAAYAAMSALQARGPSPTADLRKYAEAATLAAWRVFTEMEGCEMKFARYDDWALSVLARAALPHTPNLRTNFAEAKRGQYVEAVRLFKEYAPARGAHLSVADKCLGNCNPNYGGALIDTGRGDLSKFWRIFYALDTAPTTRAQRD